MELFYDIPYMKGILKFVLLPVALVVLVVGIILFIYSKKHKDHEDPHYNYVMNFWSSLIGVVITATILTLAIGFSLAMTEKMRQYGIVEQKKLLYYLLKYFVIIPLVFVIWYIVKLIKTVYNKPQENDSADTEVNIEKEESVEEVSSEEKPIENEVETPAEMVESQQPVETEPTEDSSLPPIEETLQEELKKYDDTENETEQTQSNEEEIEIITFDEEGENDE